MTRRSPIEPLPEGFDPHSPAAQLAHALLDRLSRRHRHQVLGIENIPDGPCLLVVNHSLATYDILLLTHVIFERLGRMPRGLGDKRLFQLPGVAALTRYFGSVRASHDAADQLLADGFIVLVAPGGMREALRASDERYQVTWDDRRGFVRLAVRTGVPIVLAACPRADDLYDVYPSELTRRAYNELHLPLPLFKGRGLSLMPHRVPLTHVIAPPIQPPEGLVEDDDEGLSRFHSEVVARMEATMTEALEHDAGR